MATELLAGVASIAKGEFNHLCTFLKGRSMRLARSSPNRR
jgi:hypothetical protein